MVPPPLTLMYQVPVEGRNTAMSAEVPQGAYPYGNINLMHEGAQRRSRVIGPGHATVARIWHETGFEMRSGAALSTLISSFVRAGDGI